MQSGNSRPFISYESVRHALDSLVHMSSGLDSALLALSLVDEFLLDPDFPDVLHSREYALLHVLSSIISGAYSDLRATYGLETLDTAKRRDEMLKLIEEDAAQGSQELMGWGWLFHHFVQINSSITSNEFCGICHIDERTLRRYQARVIKRFTDLLIEAEWAARTTQRKRRLLKELPGLSKFPLVGRFAVLEKANEIMSEVSGAHLQITGEKGVGKTAFVERLLAEQIDAHRLDQIVWINQPVSCEFVYHILVETLVPEQSRIGLRDLLQVQRVAIVIDDFDTLAAKPNDVQELLRTLVSATVFLTSSFYVPLTGTSQILLNELKQPDASELIFYLFYAINSTEAVDSQMVETIWHQVGGNPLALQLTVKNWSRINEHGLITNIGLDTIFENLFISLEESLQRAWVAFAMLAPASFEYQQVHDVWPDNLTWENINRLVDCNLLLAHIGSNVRTYSLANSAANFVRERYSVDAYVQHLVSELLSALKDKNNNYSRILEAVLLNPWLKIDASDYAQYIYREDEVTQRWTNKRIILERGFNTSAPDVNTGIAYATCLRHLGENRAARSILNYLLKYAGQRGDFANQPLILKEISVIERQTGNYENAHLLISNAAKMADNQSLDAAIVDVIALEQAQIAVDTRNIEGLDRMLRDLPSDPKTDILRSEAYLIRNDFVTARRLAESVLVSPDISLLASAHVHDVLGRIYEKLGDYIRAQEHFSWCLMILEKEGDLYSVARAQSNLGGTLIRLKYYEEAGILLKSAENHQILLHDFTGLAVTRHNLKQIDIQITTC